MNCKLGDWYSEDKITDFKVLERNEQSTSIKIKFGENGLIERETVSKEYAEGSKKMDDEFINEKKDEMSPTNNVDSGDMTKMKSSFMQQENSKTSNLRNIRSNGIEVNEVSQENLNNQDALTHSRFPIVDNEVSTLQAEEISQLESNSYDDKPEESNIAHFVSNHSAFFIALSIVNFTLAVLITLFCFIFPGAYENIKISVGKARDWTLSRIEVGVTYGHELPNFGMNIVQKGTSFISHPFNWMWRFLNYVGNCFGLKIPSISWGLISLHMPKCEQAMPKWFCCMLNCFKN